MNTDFTHLPKLMKITEQQEALFISQGNCVYICLKSHFRVQQEMYFKSIVFENPVGKSYFINNGGEAPK